MTLLLAVSLAIAQSPASAATPPQTEMPGWSLGAAILGYAAAPVVLGLALAAEFTKSSSPGAAAGLNGGAAGLLTLALPFVGEGARSVRQHKDVKGSSVLRFLGWFSYCLALGAAAPLVIVGALGIPLPDGLMTATGIVGFHALALLATDAILSRSQMATILISFAPTPDGRSVPTFGMAGMF